jgi:hypothetical protein
MRFCCGWSRPVAEVRRFVAATGYVTVAERALTRRQVRSRRGQQCRERPGRHDQSGDPRQKRATCPVSSSTWSGVNRRGVMAR